MPDSYWLRYELQSTYARMHARAPEVPRCKMGFAVWLSFCYCCGLCHLLAWDTSGK